MSTLQSPKIHPRAIPLNNCFSMGHLMLVYNFMWIKYLKIARERAPKPTGNTENCGLGFYRVYSKAVLENATLLICPWHWLLKQYSVFRTSVPWINDPKDQEITLQCKKVWRGTSSQHHLFKMWSKISGRKGSFESAIISSIKFIIITYYFHEHYPDGSSCAVSE